MKTQIEWAARARYTLPVVLALAILAMVVNEATFQHTWRTLTRGIALTDARIEAARALQAMTVMEAAARGAMVHDNPHDRQRFEGAAHSFLASRQSTFALIAKLDDHHEVGVDKLLQMSDEQVAHFRTWIAQPAPAASAPGPGSDEHSRAGIAAVQAEFDAVLAKAAAVQQVARGSLYDALALSRWAVHGLVLLSVVALVLFARELRKAGASRAAEHQRLAAQIKERTASLHDLADHLTTVREDERGRLARDLHDEMGGLLTAMKLELARLRRVPDVPAAALERLSSIDARLNDGIAFKRRVIENLRPSTLDQLGLKVALEMLCADSASVMGLPVRVNVEQVSLGSDLDLTLFRIVQESLTNIAKYAAARTVWVELTRTNDDGDDAGDRDRGSQAQRDSTVRLTVRDDGRGFDPGKVSAGRHGLLGMQVRVEGHQGSFHLHSRTGQGTTIVVTVPVRGFTAAPASA